MEKTSIYLIEFNQMDYLEALDLQHRIVDEKKSRRITQDLILMLEHPPVFTLGRRGGRENVLISEQFLEAKGISLVQIERGGNVTYHGPGQIVVYPILDLKSARLKIVEYVEKLESIMIEVAEKWNIQATRDPRNRGVWVGNNKLGSVGIAVTRYISFHGLALNVNNSLDPFSWINPCGLSGVGVTSIAREIGHPVPITAVRQAMKLAMGRILDRPIRQMNISELDQWMNNISKNCLT